ncbi:MAG: hypothetical protein DWQ31_10775 [Planctomycetota bacterium]|nr:MAG: hypothetical protein DWQ31_10775 [Planctomycetota bacterium]REJ97187.1 MAG: hypothetical protein DWQ35_02940 [Planctomycetota bacterium]REK27996.1 MAG: hypothetical protein DWQ42_06220 [Planctomycetota bacterium]REK48687.1 MAG: hypothetical protein DWQ46_01700 [Planctomycetota bacterium]
MLVAARTIRIAGAETKTAALRRTVVNRFVSSIRLVVARGFDLSCTPLVHPWNTILGEYVTLGNTSR